MTFKEKVFHLIDDLSGKAINKGNKLVDNLLIILIVVNIISIILESFDSLNHQYYSIFYSIEVVTVVIFSIEYVLRLWTANLKYPTAGRVNARVRFMFSVMGLVDLLAVLPFYLPFLITIDLRFVRMLRLIRLLRIFKLKRYSKAFQLVSTVFEKKQSELTITAFVTIILLLFSSTLMYSVEHEAQPDKFPDIVSTLWWAVATLTTVGYGDVYPITIWGKLVAGVVAILGIGLVALPTGILSASFVEEIANSRKAKKELQHASPKGMKYCPHCGQPLPDINMTDDE